MKAEEYRAVLKNDIADLEVKSKSEPVIVKKRGEKPTEAEVLAYYDET